MPLPTVPVGPIGHQGLEILSAGDFNNDGRLDLAVVYPYTQGSFASFVGIVLGNGDGTFQLAATQNAPDGPGSYVVADMNGDGNLDLVMANPINNNVSVWLGDGYGALRAPQDFGTGPNLSSLSYVANLVTVADFNQDGLPDVAVIGQTAPGPWMLFQLGTARMPAPSVSPNSLTFASQTIGTTSAPQAVNLTVAGNAPLSIAQIVTSGDFAQTNNCPSSVPVGSSCVIKVTFTPTSAGVRDGSLAVEDNAPASPEQVSLSGMAQTTNIALAVAPGGLSSVTVAAGSMATYKLTIGGAGFSGMASLTCTGGPRGTNCSFLSGATMNVSATSDTPFNVTVMTTSRSMAALSPTSNGSHSWLWAVLLMGFVILPHAQVSKCSTWRIIRLSPLVFLLLLGACGGGGTSANPNGTPAGTYALTVKATSGSVSQSLPLTLTVQ